MLARGLVVRDCTSFGLPRRIRVATRPEGDWRRLIARLKGCARRDAARPHADGARHGLDGRQEHACHRPLPHLRAEGLRVAPFKAQNMALNSFVTRDGREMGRAQVVQAEAAGIEPRVEMNPVLLKPEGDSRSQVIVMGRPLATLEARDYWRNRSWTAGYRADALATLRREYDLVIIEGAGSPVEINLARNDIVNMQVARLADAPVLLVGDIDRGGIFASSSAR